MSKPKVSKSLGECFGIKVLQHTTKIKTYFYRITSPDTMRLHTRSFLGAITECQV